MPDIITLALITLALIATAAFFGATIAVGYIYGGHLLIDWWESRNTPADTEDDTIPDTNVYDWEKDAGVNWQR